MGVARKFQMRIALAGFFERCDASEQAPIHFRKHHMHRQIRRRQAPFRAIPCRSGGCRQSHLKHRDFAHIER